MESLVSAVPSDAGSAAIIAALIAAGALLVNSAVLQWLQYRRDRELFRQQLNRDTSEYERRRIEAREMQQQQLEREAADRQRSVLAARRQRLRLCYASVLRSANTYWEVAQSLNVLLPGQTVDYRNDVLSRKMDEAQTSLDSSLALLQVEGVSGEILDLFEKVRTAAIASIMAYSINLSRKPSVPPIDTSSYQDKVAAGIKDLKEAMTHHLALFDSEV